MEKEPIFGKEKFVLEKETIEGRERFGKNVEVNAEFLRHGEKEVSITNPDTGLSEIGKKESGDYGSNLEEKWSIKSEVSDTERTKETAKQIVRTSPTKRKLGQKIKEELAFHYDKEGDFVKTLGKIKKETLGADFNSLFGEEKRERVEESDKRQIEYYLNFGDKRPDPKTYSPVETAAMIANRVDVEVRKAERLHSGTRVDSINISHDFPLAAFLKEAMIREEDGKEIRGFDGLNEIGGSIKYNEGFRILTKTDDKGIKSTDVIFRGKVYKLNEKRMKELIKIASRLKQ